MCFWTGGSTERDWNCHKPAFVMLATGFFFVRSISYWQDENGREESQLFRLQSKLFTFDDAWTAREPLACKHGQSKGESNVCVLEVGRSKETPWRLHLVGE